MLSLGQNSKEAAIGYPEDLDAALGIFQRVFIVSRVKSNIKEPADMAGKDGRKLMKKRGLGHPESERRGDACAQEVNRVISEYSAPLKRCSHVTVGDHSGEGGGQ